ncbi:MAG: HAD-IA family hydrolase [Acidimicrobiales bacterium]
MDFACVLLDYDGVVRIFNDDLVTDIEANNGLRTGAVFHAAFEPGLLARVTTGKITREQWVESVGITLGSPRAAQAWAIIPGDIDWDLISIVDDLRSRGVVVAILTNGTNEIPLQMSNFGISEHFDAVFNSAEIGITKPDPRVFQYVSDTLGITAERIFFTDDSPSKLSGATEVGMYTELYVGIDRFRTHLRGIGLL